jgi:hypothetical protein
MMYARGLPVAIWALAGLVLELQGCHLGPLPSVPDLSGTYIAQSATIQADKKTVDEILTAFKQAEAAVQHRDLDALMALYAEGYKHRGFTKDSLRAEWKHLFEDYHDFSSTHVLTRIATESDKSPPTAQITCTGSLWAISNETNQRVNIDSWFGEVHYLVYVDGAWRMRGHAWEVLNPKDTRIARPPHPFF